VKINLFTSSSEVLKFFFKLSLFLPLAIIFFGIEHQVTQVSNSYKRKSDYLKNHKDEIEMVAFGSSHAHFGFKPEQISCMNAFNLANNSQSIVLDSKLIERYLPELPKLKAVLFYIDYFSFGLRLHDVEAARNAFYINYYGISETQWGLFDLKERLMIATYGSEKTKELVEDNFDTRLDVDETNRGQFESSRIGIDVGVVHPNAGKIRVDFHNSLMRPEYYRESVRILTEAVSEISKNAKVYFVLSPVHHFYQEAMDPVIWSQTLSFLNQVVSSSANVEIIPSPTDLLLDTDFHDTDHLNQWGAAKFSSYINQYVCGRRLSTISK
jgi:hypothetical protein